MLNNKIIVCMCAHVRRCNKYLHILIVIILSVISLVERYSELN